MRLHDIIDYLLRLLNWSSGTAPAAPEGCYNPGGTTLKDHNWIEVYSGITQLLKEIPVCGTLSLLHDLLKTSSKNERGQIKRNKHFNLLNASHTKVLGFYKACDYIMGCMHLPIQSVQCCHTGYKMEVKSRLPLHLGKKCKLVCLEGNDHGDFFIYIFGHHCAYLHDIILHFVLTTKHYWLR